MIFATAAPALNDERTYWHDPKGKEASSGPHDVRHSAGWIYAKEALRIGRPVLDISNLEDLQFHAVSEPLSFFIESTRGADSKNTLRPTSLLSSLRFSWCKMARFQTLGIT
jgi:hypothetical protein